MECGRDSCRFSSGMRSLPVLDGEINFALGKAEAVASALQKERHNPWKQ
jgi:hypothetical protein